MPPPKTHEENRKLVCVVCFKKTKNIRQVTNAMEDRIKHLITNFRLSSRRFPTGICGTC